MKYVVIGKVKDWKDTTKRRKLNTFQLEESDRELYSNRLFGFSHGTGEYGFNKILQSGRIESSFNIREAQKAVNKNTTGGDRGHDGQYTVYFRFVEKRKIKTDRGIPAAIVRSLGGVGGGSGYVFFVSLNKIVQSGASFALAGGTDGLGGVNCFTNSKLEQARGVYGKNFKPDILGKTQFELGLKAAEDNCRSNEIGFYNSVSLDNVEIIMIRNQSNRNIPNYTYVADYSERNNRGKWKVYLRNDSTLNIVQQKSRISQPSQASQISQPSQPTQQLLQV